MGDTSKVRQGNMGREQDQEGDERPDVDFFHQSRQSNHQEQIAPTLSTSGAVHNVSQGPMAGSAPVPNNNLALADASDDLVNGETGAYANKKNVDSSKYSTVPTISYLDPARQENLTGRDIGNGLDKQASGRMTPPSGYSGSNQNKSSRLAAGERFDSHSNIDETGSAQISTEQSANERFAPFDGFKQSDDL